MGKSMENARSHLGAALLLALGLLYLAPDRATAQDVRGSCTHGETACQVNEVKTCECNEELIQAEDGTERVITFCSWVEKGKSCGQPVTPLITDCTPSRVGVVVEFAGRNIKTCKCYDERCYWE